jgi:hypothetical protein
MKSSVCHSREGGNPVLGVDRISPQIHRFTSMEFDSSEQLSPVVVRHGGLPPAYLIATNNHETITLHCMF